MTPEQKREIADGEYKGLSRDNGNDAVGRNLQFTPEQQLPNLDGISQCLITLQIHGPPGCCSPARTATQAQTDSMARVEVVRGGSDFSMAEVGSSEYKERRWDEEVVTCSQFRPRLFEVDLSLVTLPPFLRFGHSFNLPAMVGFITRFALFGFGYVNIIFGL